MLMSATGIVGLKEPSTRQIFGAILIIPLMAWAIRVLIKKAFVIQTAPGEIILKYLFKKRVIQGNEIEEINPYSTGNFYYISGEVTIATNITLLTGEKIVIPETLYTNKQDVREAIILCFKDKIRPPENTKKTALISGLPYQKFAGNPLFSFNSLLLLGLTALFAYTTYTSKAGKNDWFFIPFLVVFFAGFGFQMFYFVIEDSFLIVRNHYFPWYKRVYLLNNISVVSFESPYRRSDALRIFRDDQSSKLFGAGSLRTSDWDQLKEEFTKLGIAIR